MSTASNGGASVHGSIATSYRTPTVPKAETYEIFERVHPKNDGPYSFMVWAVHAMEDHWFRTRTEADKFVVKAEAESGL